MKWRFWALLVVAFCVSTLSEAQRPFKNFPDIPDNHWAYEDMAQFERGGLVGPWMRMYGSGRPKLRGEFACRLECVFERLLVLTQEIRAATLPVPKDLERLTKVELEIVRDKLHRNVDVAKHAPSWRAPIDRLIHEFSPELLDLTVNVDELQRRSDEMIGECERMSVSGFPAQQHPRQGGAHDFPSWFADIPDEHQAFEDLAYLKKQGLIEFWFDLPQMTPTRTDFTAAIQVACLEIRERSWDLELAKRTTAWGERMRRLVKEFAPDLAALCMDAKRMSQNLNLLIDQRLRFADAADPTTGQFDDVPSEHWAATATLDLRRAGILLGYPDGGFRG